MSNTRNTLAITQANHTNTEKVWFGSIFFQVFVAGEVISALIRSLASRYYWEKLIKVASYFPAQLSLCGELAGSNAAGNVETGTAEQRGASNRALQAH